MNNRWNILKIGQLFFLIVSAVSAQSWSEQNFANLITAVVIAPEQEKVLADALIKYTREKRSVSQSTCILFEEFPELKKHFSYIQLAQLPTPVETIKVDNVDLFYIKRDDMTSDIFGGNKVRKLEFLLADARARDVDTVMTFGCVASSHATATAIHAKNLGMHSILVLMPQKNSYMVHRNLLLNKKVNADMVLAMNKEVRAVKAPHAFFEHYSKTGEYPYVIPTGGSCPIGILGYVNAAFELKNQIKEGILQEPDIIYLPIGSCGTVAGLLLGLKAAGLKSKIMAISVVPNQNVAFTNKVNALISSTNELLHNADTTFPIIKYSKKDLEIRNDFAGTCYGVFTKEGQEAKEIFENELGIILDGVYSAKAAAALIDDINKGILKGKKVLFWNTFCGHDFSKIVENVSYKDLPEDFHNYFERPVQELDC